MKIKFIIGHIICATIIVLTGCSSTNMRMGDGATTSNAQLKPTNQELVKIYQSKLPKRSKIIGRVAAENYNIVGMKTSQAALMDQLKKQAAIIGANGITHISSGLTQTTADAIIVK